MSRYDSTERAFQKVLQARGLKVKRVTSDGLFVMDAHGGECEISLANAARKYQESHDPSVFEELLDLMIADPSAFPAWNVAQSGLRLVAERCDHDLQHAIWDPVSDDICRVVEYADATNKRIVWLGTRHLEEWQVSRDEVIRVASRNMAAIMDRAQVEIEQIDGLKYAMFSINELTLKASLIFSPNFQQKVSSIVLGWPVLVVIPCRDYLIAVPEEHQELMSRLGGIVVEEYEKSPYPLTTEVFRLSDDGIEAIAEFREQ